MNKKNILITGGAGFIGSNFIKTIATSPRIASEYSFHVIDALTYAGRKENIQNEIETSAIKFSQIDIRDSQKVSALFAAKQFDGVIHYAAESHVDRSIDNPNIFVETNVLGTLNLLNSSLKTFQRNKSFKFVHVSTDEVYGSLKEDEPAFTEESPLKPSSPYSASKTASDLLVLSFFRTYKLPVVVTRCSNNYGPYQFPEKLIPLMISNAIENKPLPIYGSGKNIRDWIYVDDHNKGIWNAFEYGKPGEVYNFGGNSEIRNIDIVKMILKKLGKNENLITFVQDRAGHDWRYAMNYSKAQTFLNWQPQTTFCKGLDVTIDWYLRNMNTSHVRKKNSHAENNRKTNNQSN